ncbi:MAG TPA: hypothetical protein PKC40_06030 [Saprospiraceae bacterium]|nr:hypothetical protein [Saprospiraceae bacterium]
MKKHKIFANLLLSGLFFLSGILQLSAQKESKAYYIENDEVVFEFDARLYQKAAADGTLKDLDFADFDINKVVVSGDFNSWSRKDWKMKKIGQYTFQLRKKVKDFNDVFKWEFKFLINGRYWADPESRRLDEKIISNDIWATVYNLDIYNCQPVDVGNAHFFLKGYQNAQKVILSGEFNGWKVDALKMKKMDGGWRMNLQLPVGKYEYKFIVDGNWMHDPANPKKVMNEHGTFNSILFITKPVTFDLKGFTGAKKVVLAGSFNDWNERDLKMERTESGWKTSLDLTSGKYYYKFIVDGKWMTDPGNPLSEYDNSGNLNSILLVR